jgi:hypothetical protein
MEQQEPFGTLMVLGAIAAFVTLLPLVEVLKFIILVFTTIGMSVKLFQQVVVAVDTYKGSKLETKIKKLWKSRKESPKESTTLGGESHS